MAGMADQPPSGNKSTFVSYINDKLIDGSINSNVELQVEDTSNVSDWDTLDDIPCTDEFEPLQTTGYGQPGCQHVPDFEHSRSQTQPQNYETTITHTHVEYLSQKHSSDPNMSQCDKSLLSPVSTRPSNFEQYHQCHSRHDYTSGSSDASHSDCNSPTSTASDSKSLCGYLEKYKVGSRGACRIFKKRWFIFSEGFCQLLYFRTPKDLVHLGEIDVANASLTFDIKPGSTSSIFEIRSKSKTYYLQAADRHTMMYWLQQLQKKRRSYSRRKTKLLMHPQSPVSNVTGLAGDHSSENQHATDTIDDAAFSELISSLEVPLDTVGEDTADDSSQTKIKDLSFSKWPIELKNILKANRIKKLNKTSDNNNSECKPGVQKKLHTISRMGSWKERFSKTLRPQSLSADQMLSDSQCKNCQQCQTDVSDIEIELQATRQVVSFMQKQLLLLNAQVETLSQWKDKRKVDDAVLEDLLQKDNEIVGYEHKLLEANREIDELKRSISCTEQELNSYKTSMVKKDELLLDMGQHLQESGSKQQLDNLTELQDMCSGYEHQNKFLNTEILELTHLRQDDDKREHELLVRNADLEGRYYQIKSKYLSLLKDLTEENKASTLEPHSSEMVSRLLEEAMEMEIEERQTSGTSSLYGFPQYDAYGFMRLPKADQLTSLDATLENLQRRSQEVAVRDHEADVSHQVKWENYMVSQGKHELQRSKELKMLIRGGVPSTLRPTIWKACCSWHVSQYKEGYKENYYQKLVERAKALTTINPVAKQIELDLLRTLPNNKHYESLSCDGIHRMRNVLLAYTHHNPEIGYCQGLNRLVAISLLFMEEEDAFWCLVAIVEEIMPSDYYSTTMIGAQVDQRVLKDFLAEKLPRLSAHLEKHNVDLSLFTFNWFLTVYVDNIPVETYLRIWDTFLYEGNKVLFRFAMAIIKFKEEEVLRQDDGISVHNCLRSLAESITDTNKLSQIAFIDLNPFPIRTVTSRRQYHLEKVKIELDKLNALRESFHRK